jgi:D-glycero-D-manno-heptose 1,7-bisphosphate phosphatase
MAHTLGSLATYAASAAALATVLLIALGVRVPARWSWGVTAAGVAAAAARCVDLAFVTRAFPADISVFWRVGRDVWAGVDPYGPDVFGGHPFLNPPSAVAMFAAFAAVPLRAAQLASFFANTALAWGVVWLAARALAAQGWRGAGTLSSAETGVLATALALSGATTTTVNLGQVALLAAALILGAFLLAGRSRPVAAGVALALATVKVGTVMPFLLLLHRRSDLKTWLALGAAVAALVGLSGHPERLPAQCRELVSAIDTMSRPGATNDVSYRGPGHAWILGFDHAYYRLGVRDPGARKVLELASLGVVVAWLARLVWGARVSRAGGLALASLLSVIFLYHRHYDAVACAPALVYGVAGAKAGRGRARLYYTAAAALVLLVLDMRIGWLNRLTGWVEANGTAGALLGALVLPSGTWCVLLAMACLRLADATPPAPGRGRPAVFLDRDGTIIEDVPYLSDPAHVRLLPGAAGALRRLREAGFACVVVTNQSGVGRGLFREDAVHEVHDAMARKLAAEGVTLDAVYCCFEAPAGDDLTAVDHPDRKPGPGMLLRAARELGLDLAASWMVGDKLSDALAGVNAGCRGSVLVRTGKPLPPDHGYPACDDLAAAADLILGGAPETGSPTIGNPPG